MTLTPQELFSVPKPSNTMTNVFSKTTATSSTCVPKSTISTSEINQLNEDLKSISVTKCGRSYSNITVESNDEEISFGRLQALSYRATSIPNFANF